MTKAAVILLLSISCSSSAWAQSASPNASQSEFEMKARQLAEQEKLKVPPLVVGQTKRPQAGPISWHPNIVTSLFWVGERGCQKSAWESQWVEKFGGSDAPNRSQRRNFIPIAFVPQLNPFYCALPYNDLVHEHRRPEAAWVIPWFKEVHPKPGQSVCQNRWLAIKKGNRTCYAQWSDVGPLVANHFQYVFGKERPRPNANGGSGLNISPAVRDYLGLSPTDITDWRFVEVHDVPSGPWRSYGRNNQFVQARDSRIPPIDKIRSIDSGNVTL